MAITGRLEIIARSMRPSPTQHDLLLGEGGRAGDQVPQFFQEPDDIDALR
jgi:hypothetical protein